MNTITRFLAAAGLGLAVTACGSATTASEPAATPDKEPAAVERPTSTGVDEDDPAPTDEVEATSDELEAPSDELEAPSAAAEGAYGSDPRLDMLHDRCGEGDLVACDDLYWEAPLGSGYEDFALDHGAGAGVAEEDILEYVWSKMDAREQEELCWETEKLGTDAAYEAFAEGFGPGAPPEDEFVGFVEAHCWAD